MKYSTMNFIIPPAYTLKHCMRDSKFSTICIFNNHATGRVIINHREVHENFISTVSVQKLGLHVEPNLELFCILLTYL